MKIIKSFFGIKVYLWLVLSFLLLLCGVWGYGYISGEKSNQQEVSVHTAIESVEQVNELVFLNTAVQKIVTAKNYTVLFGQEMPFSEKSALLIIKYKAKFGIKVLYPLNIFLKIGTKLPFQPLKSLDWN